VAAGYSRPRVSVRQAVAGWHVLILTGNGWLRYDYITGWVGPLHASTPQVKSSGTYMYGGA
jgi:hypothetical protein